MIAKIIQNLNHTMAVLVPVITWITWIKWKMDMAVAPISVGLVVL